MRKFIKFLIILTLIGIVVVSVIMVGIFWWGNNQYNKTFPNEPLNLPAPSLPDEIEFTEDGSLYLSAEDIESWIWAQNISELHSLDIQFTELNEIWLRCSVEIMEDRFLNLDAHVTAEWSQKNFSIENPLDGDDKTMKGYWSTINASNVLIGEQSIESFKHWFNNDDLSYSEMLLPMWIDYRLNNPVFDEAVDSVENVSIQNKTLVVQFHSTNFSE